jgi:hypothetical protein
MGEVRFHCAKCFEAITDRKTDHFTFCGAASTDIFDDDEVL